MSVYEETYNSSLSETDDLPAKLNKLCERRGYDIIQSNGQRIYSAPTSWNIFEPPKGCEIFIGHLPKNVYEPELIPVFEKIGKLYNFRLMMDFFGKTRGYAFATYYKQEDAENAIRTLNGYQIRNKSIGVYKSVDNRRLFVGNIPDDKTKFDVLEVIQMFCNGIVDVIMYQSESEPTKNRGFAFVEFENHRLAAIARRELVPQNLNIWDRSLFVDWADPVPEVDPLEMASVKVLYLRNIPISLTDNALYSIIIRIVGRGVVKTHKIKNFCFVHFSERSYAEAAFTKLHGVVLHGCAVEVEWARPPAYSRQNRQQTIPSNFCTSVPPKFRRQVRKHFDQIKDHLDLPRSSSCSPVMVRNSNSPSSSTSGNVSDSDLQWDTPESLYVNPDGEYKYFDGPKFFSLLNI